MLTDVEDGEDVRVIERSHCTRFLFETNQPLAFFRERLGEDFEGDVAAESRIAGARNFTHAAGAEESDDFVRTDFCAGGQRHMSRGL